MAAWPQLIPQMAACNIYWRGGCPLAVTSTGLAGGLSEGQLSSPTHPTGTSLFLGFLLTQQAGLQ
jgi:hypothetical protein